MISFHSHSEQGKKKKKNSTEREREREIMGHSFSSASWVSLSKKIIEQLEAAAHTYRTSRDGAKGEKDWLTLADFVGVAHSLIDWQTE